MRTNKWILLLILSLCLLGGPQIMKAQSIDSLMVQPRSELVLVEKQNGAKFIGYIISRDARELLLKTEELGNIFIPMHEISEIRPILSKEENGYSTSDLFSTRYFITTNGLPIQKGDNYIQWNLYGPDFQFGVADNFGVGVMTSWLAIPIIANAKYSIDLKGGASMALGLLAGTGSYAMPEVGGFLPYVAFTFGDRKNNITFSGGYGAIFYQRDEYNPDTQTSTGINETDGRVLLSVAGMFRLNKQFSIVFDTFIAPWGPENTYTDWQYYSTTYNEQTQQYTDNYRPVQITEKSPGLALIIPGLRWQIDNNRAFQFGFTGFYFDDGFAEFPIPMIQLYRRL